jgi:signal peptidase I
LLSLFLPGIGQLFNRQPRKTLVIGIVTHIFGSLVAHTRLLLSFWTMVASFLVLLVCQLLVAIEAARTAAAGKKPEARVPLPWLSYPLLAGIIMVSALAPSPAHTMHESGFRTYKISSESMCPTMCVGDRVVADAWAYHAKAPERGVIVMFKHASSDALFVKRVIGLPGDLGHGERWEELRQERGIEHHVEATEKPTEAGGEE